MRNTCFKEEICLILGNYSDNYKLVHITFLQVVGNINIQLAFKFSCHSFYEIEIRLSETASGKFQVRSTWST